MAEYAHNVLDITDVMTENNAAKATASGEYGTGEAIWMAFAHDGGTQKWSNDSGTGWLKWNCGTGVKKAISAYTVTSRGDGYDTSVMNTWKLYGSNDDNTWVELDSQTSISWATAEMKTFTLATPSAPYQYFKIEGSSPQYSCAIGELELLEHVVAPVCYLHARRNRMDIKGVSTQDQL
jgi:hypothetical protein